MIVCTTPTVPNAEIDEVLGLVQGNSVRARAIGRDIVAGLRSLVGGEIREYAELMATARESYPAHGCPGGWVRTRWYRLPT